MLLFCPRLGKETEMKTANRKNGKLTKKTLSNGKKTTSNSLSELETSVKDRYAKGAIKREEALCCPVSYDPKYLKVIPKEIIDKDYGCGDPSQYVNEGEVVLDLGSGGGKICYIASQKVGPKGKVIGVDFNPTMLRLARKHQKEMAKRIGWANVEFKRGRIQDLQTDFDLVDKKVSNKKVKNADDFLKLQGKIDQLKKETPLIPDNSVDVIVSNCVLNLVGNDERKQLFKEMFRVLKKGGRVAISDIVSDEFVPQELQDDDYLWSGCISGAFQEKAFVEAFEEVGFYGIEIEKRDEKPWQTVKGIEFRSVTLIAYKGKEGPCLERNQAVIYKGPWKQVLDDDGHILRRGAFTAVCDKTFNIYSRAPYNKDIIPVPPIKNISLSKATEFDCQRSVERHPKETKGQAYDATIEACSTESCC